MGKKMKERRVYTGEFKVGAVALAEKREKPVARIAQDLGVNENVLYRWIQQARDCPRSPDTDGEPGTGPPAERGQGAAGRE
jgi:transposase